MCVEIKTSPVGEKRLERNFPEPLLSLSELRHVPCASEACSEASTPVYDRFVLKITGFVLKMTGFVLKMTGIVLKITGIVLKITEFVL